MAEFSDEAEYILTADEKRRAIESAKALRQRLLDRMRGGYA